MFETKIAAIDSYRSQVPALFGNLDGLRRVLRSCSPGGGREGLQERCWRPAGEARRLPWSHHGHSVIR